MGLAFVLEEALEHSRQGGPLAMGLVLITVDDVMQNLHCLAKLALR